MNMRTKTVKELIDEGYAIVLITPEELQGADPIKVEDRLIELSEQVIQSLSKEK